MFSCMGLGYVMVLSFAEVKNLPAVQEMWVQSVGQEDPLEMEMATHSNVLAWRMDRGAWQAMVHGGHKELDTSEQQSMHPHDIID